MRACLEVGGRPVSNSSTETEKELYPEGAWVSDYTFIKPININNIRNYV